MADDVDVTNAQQEYLHEKRIENIRNAIAKPALPKIGCCHYCREPFGADDARIFCDDECATDFEQMNRFNKPR